MDSDFSKQQVIASIGAGRMGRGIAITFALAGYQVRIIDVKARSASDFNSLHKAALSDIQLTLNMLGDIGLLEKGTIDSTVARVSYFAKHDCATALFGVDVIFEAVPETLDAKKAALHLVSQFAQATAIVASTTSTILSDELQPFVTPPGRFLNAHWLNPAYLIPLVEVSPGKKTDPQVVESLNTLLVTMGKVPVVCSASPGYIVPRIQALAMNEAARMVEEGVASVDDIDKATKYGFGFRFAVLGLLEFIDWGGGDILYYASRYMTKAMDDERFASPDIIKKNMKEGRIGLSTRKGFLDYSSMDVNDYQTKKLAAFVSLLRHIGKLPPEAKSHSQISVSGVSSSPDARVIVQQYLNRMECRELAKAQAFLHPNFQMTFPGGKVFTNLFQLVEWSKTRYQTIGKSFERYDQCQNEGETVVYCYGSLSGVWLNGTSFSGIRFIDRFIVVDGLIHSQLVWNDLAETKTVT